MGDTEKDRLGESDLAMLFKFDFSVRELLLDSRDTWEFRVGTDGALVTLSHPTEDQRAAGHTSLLGSVVLASEPPGSVRSGFMSLAASRIPPGSQPSLEWPDYVHEYIDEKGHLSEGLVLPLDILPEDMRNFIQDVYGTLASYMRRTIMALRWRYDLANPHDPFAVRGSSWSLDGTRWLHLPSRTTVRLLGVQQYLRAAPAVQAKVERLVTVGIEEPLHHHLFREAWEQRSNNPRSAIVLGIAAVEVGVKACIGALVPAAHWLAVEAPSPPIFKILRDYLPSLPARCLLEGATVRLPDRVLRLIRQGVELRNDIVHVGAQQLDFDTVTELLHAALDVLWVLDYYMGFEWAIQHVSRTTAQELGLDRWDAPSRRV